MPLRNRVTAVLTAAAFALQILGGFPGSALAEAPVVAISSPAQGATTDNTPLLEYTVTGGAGAETVKVDGLVVGQVSGQELDLLADGEHTVRVESDDGFGNVGFAEVTFTVDTDAPGLSGTVPADGSENVMVNSKITLTFDEPVKNGPNINGITLGGTAVNTSRIAVNGNTMIITPSSNLSFGSAYAVAVPAGAVTDAAGNQAPEVEFSFTTLAGTTVVAIPDDNLEKIIRAQEDLPTGNITASDMSKVKEVYAPFANLENLSGLEYAVNLEILVVAFNKLSDIGPIAGLRRLEQVNLGYNHITDLSPLAGLTRLESLVLYFNLIEDISPLVNLTNLEELGLAGNKIANVPSLENLDDLEILDLSGNKIVNIGGLAGIDPGGFTTLALSDNFINDITPLGAFTHIRMLILDDNQIADITPLQGLSRLEMLRLSYNQVSNIGALVANSGLGSEDLVNLYHNNLDLSQGTQAQQDVVTLLNRGVYVTSDAPGVGFNDPEDEDEFVPIDSWVSIEFDETVEEGPNFEDITISGGGEAISFDTEMEEGFMNGTSLTLYPYDYLEQSTEYTVTIPAGAVQDEEGYVFLKEYTFTFTTQDLEQPLGTITGPAYAVSSTVNLHVIASDNSGKVSEMRFSNDGGNSWSDWEPFDNTREWQLVPGDGPKNVCAQFRDEAGNVSENASRVINLDTKKPGAGLTAPLYASSVANGGTFKVSWTGADTVPSSGLKNYDVQYRIGGTKLWRNWLSNTKVLSGNFKGTIGATYHFRVRARDNAGNTGAWFTTSSIVPYDNGSLKQVRRGFGGKVNGDARYYRSTAWYSLKKDDYIEYRGLKGNSITLIGTNGPGCSKAAIYVDGIYKGIIDTYAPSAKYRQPVYTITGLNPNVFHKIKIVNRGTHGRKRLDVDAVALGRP